MTIQTVVHSIHALGVAAILSATLVAAPALARGGPDPMDFKKPSDQVVVKIGKPENRSR